jgi:hypothetical protein
MRAWEESQSMGSFDRSSKLIAVLAVNLLALAWAGDASAQETAPAGGGAAAAPAPSGGATASANVNVRAPGGMTDDPKGTLIPLVLAGLGGAQIITGLILVAAAPDTPANCNEDSRTCARNPGQSDASLREDQETAGQAKQMPTLGGIAIVSGTIFAATGLGMYFWYNGDSSKKSGKAKTPTTPTILPYAGPGGGGLTAVARF